MALSTIGVTQSWYNSDGLELKYGPDKTNVDKGGEYRTNGSLREVTFKLDLTQLTSTSQIISDQIFFPKNVFIEQVILDVSTAATSVGSPTLDIGEYQTDRTTAISATQFIAAEILSGVLDTVGKKITYTAGTSKAGAGIGTVPTLIGYLTARANTATFTAGIVEIRINYRVV